MIDPQIKFYKAAFSQRGAGFEILIFKTIFKCQNGQVVSDVLCKILRFIPSLARFFKPVAITGAQTVL